MYNEVLISTRAHELHLWTKGVTQKFRGIFQCKVSLSILLPSWRHSLLGLWFPNPLLKLYIAREHVSLWKILKCWAYLE